MQTSNTETQPIRSSHANRKCWDTSASSFGERRQSSVQWTVPFPGFSSGSGPGLVPFLPNAPYVTPVERKTRTAWRGHGPEEKTGPETKNRAGQSVLMFQNFSIIFLHLWSRWFYDFSLFTWKWNSPLTRRNHMTGSWRPLVLLITTTNKSLTVPLHWCCNTETMCLWFTCFLHKEFYNSGGF